MAIDEVQHVESAPLPEPEHVPGLSPRRQGLGSAIVKWMTTTDHKTIGYMYLTTSFAFFCLGGLLALAIRAELFQ
ncbi:MAG: cytochrome ubiquinol oxidase subunit I, partial [Salana multivorans]|nr:cytochrome ubiquinol oxidase subunit I [Salana multivorans]